MYIQVWWSASSNSQISWWINSCFFKKWRWINFEISWSNWHNKGILQACCINFHNRCRGTKMCSTIVWLLFVLVYYDPVFHSNLYTFWAFQVVGIDRKNGYRIMSFQELSTRARGSKDALVAKESIKVGSSHAGKKLQKWYSRVANSGMTIIAVAGWCRYAIAG